VLDRSHCGAVLILAHFHSFSKILVHRSCEILSEVVYNRSPRDLSSISRTSRRFPILRPMYFSTITDTPSLEKTHFSRTIQSHPRPACLNSSHLTSPRLAFSEHFSPPAHLFSALLLFFLPRFRFIHMDPNMTSQASSPAASAARSQDAFRKPCAATRTEAPMDIWSKAGRSMGALRSNMVSKCFGHKRLRPMETVETVETVA